jgi:uncharacterized protein YggU (UPF0235/DUF167 family)
MTARLPVRVHPGALSEGLTGRLADGTLRLAVRAAPEGGRANRAVTDLLARLLGVARGRVSVVRGPGSRAKVVEVEGLDEAEVKRRIDEALRQRGRTDGE